MAETEGFEPSIRLATYDDLANRCLQPLGHVSPAFAGAGLLPRFVPLCKQSGAKLEKPRFCLWEAGLQT